MAPFPAYSCDTSPGRAYFHEKFIGPEVAGAGSKLANRELHRAFGGRRRREAYSVFLLTDLHEGDEDDEQRRRATSVVIGVVLPVPFLRQEFVADHADHPENENDPRQRRIRGTWLGKLQL